MIPKRICTRRGLRASAIVLSGALFALGFLNSCNDRLVALTGIVDPCGTVFANCTPGQFQLLNADIGDGCIDPACTVPGGCGAAEQPLGTVRQVCP